MLADKWDKLGLMNWYDPSYGQRVNTNDQPGYRKNWDLSSDTNFQAGVMYMARFTPREPACFVMLGVACLAQQNRELHLAIAAFEKATKLGSLQKPILQERIA